MTRSVGLVLAAAILASAILASGCHNHVFSPPARAAPLETVATLPVGDMGVQAEVAGHGEVFGPNLESGAVRVRRGVDESTDLSAEATVLHVDERGSAGTHPNAYSARVGVKEKVASFLSLTTGLGGGGSAAGAFFSPDLGAILAYENAYFVPFFSYRLSFSQPIRARAVDTSPASSPVGSNVSSPRSTWINAFTVGFRVPVPSGSHANSDSVRTAILAGLSLTQLDDFDDSASFASGTLAVEVLF